MAKFQFSFQQEDLRFDLGFAAHVGITDIAEYAGSYEVTPSVSPQRLATAEKYMKQDVNVLAIPYFDVSNPAGGSTVYIAETTEVR